MFNGRFSHTRFSLRGGSELDVRITGLFIETGTGLAFIAQDASIAHNFRELGRALIIATTGIKYSVRVRERAYATINGVRNYTLASDFTEQADVELNLSNFVSFQNDFEEIAQSDIIAAYSFRIIQTFNELAENQIFIGSNTHLYAAMSEAGFLKSNATMIDKDMLIINATIPPGKQLIINSEDFTINLDGENILHLHEGDWINISRDTLDLIIASGGQLTGTLIYTERYL